MLLTALLCNVCFLTTPDGIPYIEIPGTYRSIWKPNRQDISYGVAASVQRVGGSGATVGAQINGWAMAGVHSQTWGVATEAVAEKGSKSILVGLESLVVNREPTNDSQKIGVNIVYNSPVYANKNSIGLWFTSTPNTGWNSGIKFDRVSLKASNGTRAAVIDLSEIDPVELSQMDLIKLPNGKAIRWTGKELKVY